KGARRQCAEYRIEESNNQHGRIWLGLDNNRRSRRRGLSRGGLLLALYLRARSSDSIAEFSYKTVDGISRLAQSPVAFCSDDIQLRLEIFSIRRNFGSHVEYLVGDHPSCYTGGNNQRRRNKGHGSDASQPDPFQGTHQRNQNES